MAPAGLTRREVLVAGGGAAAAAGLLGGPSARVAVAAGSPLRRSTWLALSEHTLGVRQVGLPWRRLTLREVADLPRAATLVRYRGSEDAFSLVFDGLPGGVQGTYTIDHPVIGRFRLFLTPVGRGSGLQTYQAIVDRLFRPTARHPAPR
jgi:hypothetical protein